MVAYMAADMKVHMVADMAMDKVADMVADKKRKKEFDVYTKTKLMFTRKRKRSVLG